jgi:PAS domain S-box-containing protein
MVEPVVEISEISPDRLAAINSVARVLTESKSATELADKLFFELRNWIPFDAGFLDAFDEKKSLYSPLGYYDTIDGVFQRVELDRSDGRKISGLTRKILGDKEARLYTQDTRNQLEVVTRIDTFGDDSRKSQSIIYVPLIYKDTEIGIFSLQSYKQNIYNREDLNFLNILGYQVAPAIEGILLGFELSYKEELFRQLAENIPGAIIIYMCCSISDLIYVNEHITGITGHLPYEFISGRADFSKLIDERFRHKREQCLMQATQDMGRFQLQYQIIDKNGCIHWIEEIGGIIKTNNNQQHIQCYINDITEKVQTKDTLKNLNQIYIDIIKNSAGVPYFYNKSTNRYEMIGNNITHLLNLPYEEVTPSRFKQLLIDSINVRDAPEPLPKDGKLSETNSNNDERMVRPMNKLYKIRAGNNKVKWISDDCLPTTDLDGEVVGYKGILRDVTEEFNIKEETKRNIAYAEYLDDLTVALKKNDDLPSLLQNICKVCIKYGKIPDAVIAFKSPNSDVLGSIVSTIPAQQARRSTVHQILLEKAIEIESRYLEAVHGEKREQRFEFEPTEMYKVVIGFPIALKTEFFGVLYALSPHAITFDSRVLTQLEQLAIQTSTTLMNARLLLQLRAKNEFLENSVLRYQRAERGKEQFYRFLIHDLNKPLAVIRGFAKKLFDSLKEIDKEKQIIGYIRDSADRIHDIVEKHLSYEMIQKGEITPTYSSFDVNATLLKSLLYLTDSLSSGKVHFNNIRVDDRNVVYPIEELHISSDEELLSRVFTNLIDNANRYSHGNIDVNTSVNNEGDIVEICIWSDGPPIPPEEHDAVFEEFYRGANQDGTGHGLGLASVVSILKILNGNVWIEPKSEKLGNAFIVRIPAGNKNEH